MLQRGNAGLAFVTFPGTRHNHSGRQCAGGDADGEQREGGNEGTRGESEGKRKKERRRRERGLKEGKRERRLEGREDNTTAWEYYLLSLHILSLWKNTDHIQLKYETVMLPCYAFFLLLLLLLLLLPIYVIEFKQQGITDQRGNRPIGCLEFHEEVINIIT